jgi:hypothetical protein
MRVFLAGHSLAEILTPYTVDRVGVFSEPDTQMLKRRIGKRLFPHLREWERVRNVNRIIFAIVGTIAFAAVVLWLWFSNDTTAK